MLRAAFPQASDPAWKSGARGVPRRSVTPNRVLPFRARYHRQNRCHAFESSVVELEAIMRSIDKSLNSSIKRARSSPRVVVTSPRVPQKTSAPGLFRTELKAAFPAAFG